MACEIGPAPTMSPKFLSPTPLGAGLTRNLCRYDERAIVTAGVLVCGLVFLIVLWDRERLALGPCTPAREGAVAMA